MKMLVAVASAAITHATSNMLRVMPLAGRHDSSPGGRASSSAIVSPLVDGDGQARREGVERVNVRRDGSAARQRIGIQDRERPFAGLERRVVDDRDRNARALAEPRGEPLVETAQHDDVDAGVIGDGGLRARQRRSRRCARDEKPLALLLGGREQQVPIDRSPVVAISSSRARSRSASSATPRNSAPGMAAASRARGRAAPLQRRPLAEDPRGREQVFGALAQALASGGHGELDAGEPFGLGEAAQRADGENRTSRRPPARRADPSRAQAGRPDPASRRARRCRRPRGLIEFLRRCNESCAAPPRAERLDQSLEHQRQQREQHQ